jgi:hypothetical protein
MEYLIFRMVADGTPQKIGETRYYSDARSILDNWHSGFINIRNGDTVYQKNIPGKAE